MTELVRGEAPESDEELTSVGAMPKQMTFTATETPGEATESDEEIYEQQPSNTVPQSNIHNKAANVPQNYNNSLLKRKLIDNNLSISRSLNALIKNQFISASKELIAADQLLIKSQLTMQSVLMSIKSTKSNLKQLLGSVSHVCTANFIPDLQPWKFQIRTHILQAHEEQRS